MKKLLLVAGLMFALYALNAFMFGMVYAQTKPLPSNNVIDDEPPVPDSMCSMLKTTISGYLTPPEGNTFPIKLTCNENDKHLYLTINELTLKAKDLKLNSEGRISFKVYPSSDESSILKFKGIISSNNVNGTVTDQQNKQGLWVLEKIQTEIPLLKDEESEENILSAMTSVDIKALLAGYKKGFVNKISSNWNPPAKMTSKKFSLAIFIDKSGKLIDTQVYESSNDKDLDNSAILAVKKSAPFGPLPEEYPFTKLAIRMVFDYIVRIK